MRNKAGKSRDKTPRGKSFFFFFGHSCMLNAALKTCLREKQEFNSNVYSEETAVIYSFIQQICIKFLLNLWNFA